MVSQLPRGIQLKLERTLAQWPRWQCTPPLTSAPEIVEILAPGIGNFSVLVESGRRFVIRIDGLNPSANGLNRQTEWRTLEDAHKAGVAPRPRYFNPELGSMVCDYLEPELHSIQMPEVAGLLRAIHQLPARHHRLDLAERILRYEKLLEHRGIARYSDIADCHARVRELLTKIGDGDEGEDEYVLCHNDLLCANRIYHAGKLWALDWEYCAMGSPWYDLAVIINGDALDANDADALVSAYLGRDPRAPERDKLHRYGCIYRYLELLWYLALDRPVFDADTLEQKSTILRNMLAERQTKRPAGHPTWR